MSFFQTTVTKKYANTLNKELLKKTYTNFKAHFHNSGIQENIRNSKEEQYQEGFFRDLFVNILGYKLNPEPNFNLITEKKNVSGSKKSDGAIIINGNVAAVIELKGTDTTDLSKVEAQAFGYKNNQVNCTYVITSNFEKLWFYIDNAIDHLEFNLFTLSEAEFELLYLCLSFDAIKDHIPKKIKAESLSEEDTITKKLYKDYSLFKRELHQNLVELNPQFDALVLFKKSQKLLDRFLFLFFAEDSNLLPPNSVRLVLNDWRDLQERDEYTPLYSRFKKYFGYLNTGFKGKRYDVFAYNGGLFKPDDLLDTIKIDDELLFKHTHKLSDYNFSSEVDVNILGHIFENSLNELDEIQAQLEGKEIDKAKTKRKKDGVFYTPKYITKYIVENTIGKLCLDKKAELLINEADYFYNKKRTKEVKAQLQAQLKTYREWLLQLTICDPACGSGAFLNQALDFLINEHKYLDELQAKLFGDTMVLNDVSKSILENNLFGVDLNEESVEIAKLSLWLRTAQPNRKLNDLNNNIKCGNSLIDDPEIAGDKAFNWAAEFPQVFEKGGFDVIIGNPPYGAFLNENEKKYFKGNYEVTEYNFDTYNFFFELSFKILLENGYLGFITPNTFLVVENGILLRKFLFIKNSLVELYETFNVFSDAVVEPINIILKKTKSKNDDKFSVIIDSRNKIESTTQVFSLKKIIENESLIFNYRATATEINLFDKIKNNSKSLSIFAKITTGVKPYQVGKGLPKQTKDIVNTKPFTSFESKEGFVPVIRGTQINRYETFWDGEYIKYGNWLAEPRKSEIFFNEKIFIRRTDDNLFASYDNKGFVGINSVHVLQAISNEVELKYFLALINSKLCNWYFRHENFHMVGKPLAEVKVVFVERLPIIISKNPNFVEYVNLIIQKKIELTVQSGKFQRTIQRKFDLSELSTKLENWYSITFKEFIGELAKKKIKLSLSQEAEWEDYFLAESQKLQAIKAEIDKTDKEIDAMVYQLYGLTEEEIQIIEGN